MGIYLDQLRSTLNDVQSKHITNLLKQEKDSGQIQNLEDFSNRLQELTSTILSDQITPSLTLFFAQLNDIIDSDTYNYMLDRIRDDLEAIFSELNTIDEIIDAHNNLVNNVILKALKYGVNELDNKITFYEFLAANPYGFTQSMFNTFSGISTNRTFRTDPDVNILFQDPQTQNILQTDVTVDTVGEKILLGADDITYYPARTIQQIFDSEAPQSEDLVAFDSLPITNVIDGANGTYWTYSILQKQINPNGITAKLEIDLGVITEINFIEIECASIYPMNLVKIQYLNANNVYVNIGLNGTILNTTNRVGFQKVSTSKIIVVIQQLNALEVQYENKTISDNFDSVIASGTADPSTKSIATELRQNITSSNLLQNAFLIDQNATPGQSVKYYDYAIGFDNIRIGFADYANDSIFVSSSVQINSLKQIGLKATETRPVNSSEVITETTNTNPTVNVGYFMGSIEYYVVLQNFNSNQQLVDINVLPILPVGVSTANHEKLILNYSVGTSDIPNTGILRFYTLHFSIPEISKIFVYRNGTLLTHISDWVFEDFPYTNDVIPPNGAKNSVGIRILSPKSTDFYTVTYPVLFSNTKVHPSNLGNIDISFETDGGIKVVDLIGDGSATIDNNSIINILSEKHNGQTIAYTKVNLIVILRKNGNDAHISPTVAEYTLLLNNNGQ